MSKGSLLLKYSPIVQYGIPELKQFSKEWLAFWSEQYYRCIHGYKPSDGVWIPGNYYFHLNFWTISRLRYDLAAAAEAKRIYPLANDAFDPEGIEKKFESFPLYRDSDHELFEKIRLKRLLGRGGLMILKGRRKAATEDIIGGEIAYTMVFHKGSKCAIGVPDDDTYLNTIPILHTGWNNLPVELFQNFSVKNRKGIEVGVEISTEEGEKKMGALSRLSTKVFTHSGALKGTAYSTVFIDESGKFGNNPTLEQCFMDSEDCFHEGEMWFGLPIIAGTSDQINIKNSSLQNMWENAEAYGLDRHFIPGDKVYPPFFDFSTGKSDRPAARKSIEARRKELDKANDKGALIKFIQNQPLEESELFLVGLSNDIDVVRVNSQIKRVMEDPKLRGMSVEGDLDWVKRPNDKGVVEETGEVVFIRKKGGDFVQSLPPINDVFADADIMAVDDYMKDEAPESDSLGGSVAYRRQYSLNAVCMVPTMTYLGRPNKRWKFHDAMLKMAVYNGCRAAVEYNDDLLKDYFLASKKVNGRKYLKTYPRVSGKVVQERDAYGYNVKDNMPEIKMRIKEWVDSPALENCTDIRFLRQIAIFGKKNSDLGSAFGIILLYNADLELVPVKKKGDEKTMGVEIIGYTVNHQTGKLELRNGGGGSSEIGKMYDYATKLNSRRHA